MAKKIQYRDFFQRINPKSETAEACLWFFELLGLRVHWVADERDKHNEGNALEELNKLNELKLKFAMLFFYLPLSLTFYGNRFRYALCSVPYALCPLLRPYVWYRRNR